MSIVQPRAAARASQYLVAVVSALAVVSAAWAAGPTGAIFTTTPDGTVVNENVHYINKLYVYLDGGPGPNAPQTAAGLDDGWYVFQVTDPSGKYLLSMDPSKCRVFNVTNGIITGLVAPTALGFADNNYTVGNGNSAKTYPCHVDDSPDQTAGNTGRHDISTDTDYGANGAKVIQLMPFGDTPNPGNVYKAWAEKYATYIAKGGDLSDVPTQAANTKKVCPNFCADPDPGFGPPNTDTKTDNFKVKLAPFVAPEITVKKFHDKNANGVFDGTDEWVTGWAVDWTDPNATSGTLYTPWTILGAPAGNWLFTEETPAGTQQTALQVTANGVTSALAVSPSVTLNVLGTTSGETYEVVYGNVALGSVEVCKSYGTGPVPANTTPIPNAIQGWKIVLTGTTANGAAVSTFAFTGSSGCVLFTGLLPGNYTVTEVIPAGSGWNPSDVTSHNFTITSSLSGNVISANTFRFVFVNFCTAVADFDTKGYWHNTNGIAEITAADIAYVNGLDPYNDDPAPLANPTAYYWDLPFDGTWVPSGNTYHGTGAWGEISDYLVNYVSDDTIRFQLSQQLLAFIFNVRHRIGGGGSIYLNGAWVTTDSIINGAIAAWQSGNNLAYWEQLLDGLNNDDTVDVSSPTACALPNFL